MSDGTSSPHRRLVISRRTNLTSLELQETKDTEKNELDALQQQNNHLKSENNSLTEKNKQLMQQLQSLNTIKEQYNDTYDKKTYQSEKEILKTQQNMQSPQTIKIKELNDEIKILQAQLKFSNNQLIEVLPSPSVDDEKQLILTSSHSNLKIIAKYSNTRTRTPHTSTATTGTNASYYNYASCCNTFSSDQIVFNPTDVLKQKEEEYQSMLLQNENECQLLIAEKQRECEEQLKKMKLETKCRINTEIQRLKNENKRLKTRLNNAWEFCIAPSCVRKD